MATKQQKPPIAKKKHFLRTLKFRQSARSSNALTARQTDAKRMSIRRSRSDLGDYERDDDVRSKYRLANSNKTDLARHEPVTTPVKCTVGVGGDNDVTRYLPQSIGG